VSRPVLRLLGPRPHRTHEGKLSYELFCDYDLEQARIRLWTRTAINRRLYQTGLGQPHHPLAWHAPYRTGSRMIDWAETNRRKSRSGSTGA